jgi:hypothetical protein
MIRFWGHVDGAQLIREAASFFDNAEARAGLYLLWDAREIKSLDLTPDDVQRIVEHIHRAGPGVGPARSAVVAVSPDVDVAARLIRVRAALEPGRKLEIFNDVEAALRWLGGDEPETIQVIARAYADEEA